MSISEELERREKHLSTVAGTQRKREERDVKGYEKEKQAYEQKRIAKVEQEKQSGKNSKGKPPQLPEPGPRPKDRINVTNDESRIMPTNVRVFFTQTCVEIAILPIAPTHITQQLSDKEQTKLAIKELEKIPKPAGIVEELIADNEYFNQVNMEARFTG